MDRALSSDVRSARAGCCRLQAMLAEAVAAFHAVLDRYTLADMTANRRELVRAFLMHGAHEEQMT